MRSSPCAEPPPILLLFSAPVQGPPGRLPSQAGFLLPYSPVHPFLTLPGTCPVERSPSVDTEATFTSLFPFIPSVTTGHQPLSTACVPPSCSSWIQRAFLSPFLEVHAALSSSCPRLPHSFAFLHLLSLWPFALLCSLSGRDQT